MIITVTLNAAIDKSLSVPELPARSAPPHRRADDDARAARASTSRARSRRSAQPVIATGLAGGPTGTRIVEQLTEESILNDFVRIREESRTNTAVHDPTTGEQTEINERGPRGHRARDRAVPRTSCSTCRAARSIVVFAGSLPRGVDPDLYADLIRELAKAGITTVVDTDGEPLRHAVRAEPDVISPNILEAEELVGHEFNDDEDTRHRRPRDARPGRARGDHDDARRLLRARACEDGEPRCTASGSSRARRSRRSAPATRSSPATSPPATPARRPPSACAYGVACGAESTQRLGAGLVDPARVERLAQRDRGGAARRVPAEVG